MKTKCFNFAWLGNLIDYISFCSSYLPVLVGWALFSKFNGIVKKFVIFFSFIAITDLLVLWLGLQNKNNVIVSNFYTILESLFLFYLFNSLSNQQNFKKLLVPIAVLYSFFWLKINFFPNTIHTFHPFDEGIKGIIFIFLSMRLLIEISNDLKLPLYNNYRFWLVMAMLLYFSTTFIVFVTSTWLIKEEQVMAMRYTWFIHSFATILTNILSTYGLICFYQRKNSLYLLH